MNTYDLDKAEVRGLNQQLHDEKESSTAQWEILNPKGNHAVAVGVNAPLNITIKGPTGYYCAGMNKSANIVIKGTTGPGVAENMMSGSVTVEGDAGQYAGATAHGGLINIKGNASSRCAISLKGADIVVHGNVGHMSAFMAQSGSLVVLGDAGDAFGDSIYEAKLFVRGSVKSLGADCIEKEMKPEHVSFLDELLKKCDADAKASEFKRYGSARKLYNFNVDHADEY